VLHKYVNAFVSGVSRHDRVFTSLDGQKLFQGLKDGYNLIPKDSRMLLNTSVLQNTGLTETLQAFQRSAMSIATQVVPDLHLKHVLHAGSTAIQTLFHLGLG